MALEVCCCFMSCCCIHSFICHCGRSIRHCCRKHCCGVNPVVRKKVVQGAVRIAFTSCIHQRNPDLTFKHMENVTPDVAILAGDNIYVDALPICECCNYTCGLGWQFIGSGLCINKPDPLLDWEEEYNRLLERGGASGPLGPDQGGALLPCVMLCTWDDHDFGGNDILGNEHETKGKGGKGYADRDKSKEAFVKFFRKIDDARGGRLARQIEEISEAGRGIYYYYDHHKEDTAGMSDEIVVRFYMLDNRYDRSDDDILGWKQWVWLQDTIEQASTAGGITHHVFVYGSTMNVAQVHIGIGPVPSETWPDSDRDRFVQLLSDNAILDKSYLLSGDIHFSVVNLLKRKQGNVYEFVASSHSHSLINYIFNIYNCLVCCKKCCSTTCPEHCGVNHGWPVDHTETNVNGIGVVDISNHGATFSVISQKDGIDSNQDEFDATIQYSVVREI